MNYKLKLILLTNAVQVFAATLLTPVFALFIKEAGGGPELAGILFSITFVVTGVGNVLMIRVEDARLRNVWLYKLGLLVKLVAWIVLVMYQTIPALIVAQVILGIATAVGSPSFSALVSDHLDKHKHISGWAQWNLMSNIATAISSGLSGFIIVKYGFSMLFAIMAFVTALAFVLSLGITKRRHKRR